MYDPKTGKADVKRSAFTWHRTGRRREFGSSIHAEGLSKMKPQNEAVKTCRADRVGPNVKALRNCARPNEAEHKALLAAGWIYTPEIFVYDVPGYHRPDLPAQKFETVIDLMSDAAVIALVGRNDRYACDSTLGHMLFCHGGITLPMAMAVQEVLNDHPELLDSKTFVFDGLGCS